jgi:glycosyltransferase involved in cell wall biosynthesis
MKIAFVSLGFKPFTTSGLDVSAERVVQGFIKHGHSVTVIAASKGTFDEIMSDPGLTIYRLPMDRTDWIGYSLRASRLLSSLGHFDAIHFWDVHFACAFSGKYVATLHQSFRQRMEILGSSGLTTARRSAMKIYYFLARWLAETQSVKRAAGLMAVSKATRDEFIRSYNISGDKIALTRHGIDINRFFPRPNRGLVRKQLGLEVHEPLVLFAGFVTPRKGLEYLAQAFPSIHPLPKLLIVGKWRSDAYRQYILAQFGSYTDRVIELGFVEEDRLPEIYSAADIYVSPSMVEGFGLPLGEALACGTPVVAFDTGSVAEVVGDGGILVPPLDVTGFSSAISDLLQEPERRKLIAELGRQHIVSEFSVDKSIQSTLDAYQTFLGVEG